MARLHRLKLEINLIVELKVLVKGAITLGHAARK